MFLYLKDLEGNEFIVKKTDIRRIYKDNKSVIVTFRGTKNTPIRVDVSVVGMFDLLNDRSCQC